MFVPTDSFGGMTPEEKAADALKKLFTFVAIRTVLNEEEEREKEPDDFDLSTELKSFVDENPMIRSDEWLSKLLRHSAFEMRASASRILELREEFAEEDFKWERVQDDVLQSMKKDNGELMKNYMIASMSFSSLDLGSVDEGFADEGEEDEKNS
ncbi:hypothetical protein CYMTET_53945 [Cymbomonas tetramitiformis]|uniref:Uncharacterized protein n=1 Tax=Cymbomonas tetramitiformis TaxID=36881 RepID=A0AAE0ER85_9CHLO|nr:hypothetical protein CYMTET_53945 [Cymbomonas tetramitiformis]|eukprot:gene16434-19510_t